MEFWNLFMVALMPVLKVLLITALGTILAIERFDILGDTARKNLNHMVFYVFGPAIVYSSLAKTITLNNVLLLWFMPVNVLLTFLIGTALGWLLIKITRVPLHLHGLVLGCCAAGNLGNLPLIIVPAVCKKRNNPFGDVDVCKKNALAYASLSMALGSIYIWSYVYNIVRIYSRKVSSVDDSIVKEVIATENGDTENPSKSQTDDHVKQLEIECIVSHQQAKVSSSSTKQKIRKRIKILTEKINLKALFAPSTIGTVCQ
ncbi:hypothetical protein PIB30_040144 [Stylosanthes scabra]|uniref:PIN-like protein n=1 Tax=Stylosanthes scabra TaxID=79078 RepID=A0ABU6VD50_9FABA|nr:hypothetical protein [Stylosanthes scabra]